MSRDPGAIVSDALLSLKRKLDGVLLELASSGYRGAVDAYFCVTTADGKSRVELIIEPRGEQSPLSFAEVEARYGVMPSSCTRFLVDDDSVMRLASARG